MISVYSGSSCDDASCLDITDYGCGSATQRRGTAWLANASVTYFVFVHDFEGAGDFVLNFERLSPSPAPSSIPSMQPSLELSAEPSSSLMPTTSECVLEIRVMCTASTGEDCSSYRLPIYASPDHPLFGEIEHTVNVTLPVSISAPTFGRTVVLQTLIMETNFLGNVDLSAYASGVKLKRGQSSVIVYLTGTLELLFRQTYTMKFTFGGVLTDGGVCYGSNDFGFDAGEPGSPTLSPTSTMEPTADQEGNACALRGEIFCEEICGACEGGSCGYSSPPNTTLCTSGYPTSLSFVYNRLSCDASTHRGRRNACLDLDPDGPSEFDICRLDVVDLTNELLIASYESVVGDQVVFRFENATSSPDMIQVTIFEISEENDWGWEARQIVELGISCDNEFDDISLLTQYGGLLLTGFETPYHGLQNAFADFDLRFEVTNIGDGPAEVVSASSESDLSTMSLDDVNSDLLEMQGQYVIRMPHRVNLIDLDYRQVYQASFQVNAVNPANGLPCSANETYTISINSE